MVELVSLPVVYWRYAIRDFPFHAFVDDFIVPRGVLGWWIQPPIATNVPQDYVGNIAQHPSKWGEIFPADIFLGWRPAANKIARHAFDTLYYVTNSQGFSVVERFDEIYEVPKPASVYRVIVLGGSTVMGAGVPDPRKALPAKLLEELKKLPALQGRKVEVINAGVVGYDIGQEYLYMITRLYHFEPDLVVAYHGWNDFGISTAFNTLANTLGPFQANEYTSLSHRLNQSFSALGGLVFFAGNVVTAAGELWSQLASGHILRSLAHRAGSDLTVRPATMSRASVKDIKFNPKSVDHFLRFMKAFISLGRDWNFRVGLMLQPHGLNSPKPFSDFEKNYISEATKSALGQAGMNLTRDFYVALQPELARLRKATSDDPTVCVADVSDAFRETNETVYIDTGHLNEAGETIVARRLAKELSDCRVFDGQ